MRNCGRRSLFHRLAAGKLDDLADCPVDLHAFVALRRSLAKIANPVDDRGGSVSIPHNVAERLPRLVRISPNGAAHRGRVVERA